MERGFLWIVLVIQFTMTLATNSSSTVTSSSMSSSSTQMSAQLPSVISLESYSSSSISSSSTSTAQMPNSGGPSIISASSAVSASSTMQQTATVLSHSTTASTSSVNTTQGAITNSTAAEETLSTNPKTSQLTSTYSQNLSWSPSRKLLGWEFFWSPFIDFWILRVKWKCHWSLPKWVNLFPSAVIFRTSFCCHGFVGRQMKEGNCNHSSSLIGCLTVVA